MSSVERVHKVPMKLRKLTLKFKSHGQMSSRTSHLTLRVELELEDQPAHFLGHGGARFILLL